MAKEIPDITLEYNLERARQEATMGIFAIMERDNVSRADLARKLGKGGPPFVTKILSGSHNFELDTLTKVYASLGRALHFWMDDNFLGLAIPEDRCMEANRLTFRTSSDSATRIECGNNYAQVG